MKTNLAFYGNDQFRKAENPTIEERVNFLEHTLRRMQPHEVLCDSRFPEFVERSWGRSPKVIKPNPCDCWLSEPFGSIGLRIDA